MRKNGLNFFLIVAYLLFFEKIPGEETSTPSYRRNIPHLVSHFFPAVEPLPSLDLALPDDFICASRSANPDLYQGVFWGNPQTLKSYFAGELPLKSCVIGVKWSSMVKQKGPHELEADQRILKDLNRMGRSELTIRKGAWGHYPLISVECVSLGGTHYYVAWVGLNLPEGDTLMMTFLCPDSMNCPSSEELAIWYALLINTKIGLDESDKKMVN